MIICPFCGTIQIDPLWVEGDDCPECNVGVLVEVADDVLDNTSEDDDDGKDS